MTEAPFSPKRDGGFQVFNVLTMRYYDISERSQRLQGIENPLCCCMRCRFQETRWWRWIESPLWCWIESTFSRNLNRGDVSKTLCDAGFSWGFQETEKFRCLENPLWCWIQMRFSRKTIVRASTRKVSRAMVFISVVSGHFSTPARGKVLPLPKAKANADVTVLTP